MPEEQSQSPVQALLTQDVNRREFLAHMGAATLALIGVSELIKKLTDPHDRKRAERGFGYGPYGK